MIIKNINTGKYEIMVHESKNSIVEICNLQFGKLIGYETDKYLVKLIKSKIKKLYGK
jgi:hypothetical protein